MADSAAQQKMPEDQQPADATTEEAKFPEAQPLPEPPEPTGPSAEQELLLMKDQLLRALAETENLRKRTSRELEDANKYAVTAFARDMVGVMENLYRALHNIPADARQSDANLNLLAEGIEITLNELHSSFARQNIRRIDPAGEKFDHQYHQAVAQVESAEVPNGNILQVLQAGYVIHDRLLRPAMVAVSKGSSEAPKSVDTQA